MRQSDFFGKARWIAPGAYVTPDPRNPDPEGTPHFPVMRRHFNGSGVKKATLYVLGLGFFRAYINGEAVSEDRFLPLSSDYEPRPIPVEEKLYGHRIYVPSFDVTGLLRSGENLLAVHFGGGWYTNPSPIDGVMYGSPKVIYRLVLEKTDGEVEEVLSSPADKFGDSYVKTLAFITEEHQDYTGYSDDTLNPALDDSDWPCGVEAPALDTEYEETDCPADRLAESMPAILLKKDEKGSCYDIGKSISGGPVLLLKAKKGEKVTVYFSEACLEDGSPDPVYHHDQIFDVISDGKERVVRPEFMWFAFRYFRVEGDAEVLACEYYHTDLRVTGFFHSDNATLNWLYEAYLNTQLCNMHTGIPSDCPHLERRGYTGDGQLTCHAVMNTIETESFYRKWITDISDCQDIYSGHVQYTAPYLRSGGGPGGWGIAIIEVPWQFYKHYGDREPMARLYPQMLRYFDYLESHSENNLVVSDKAGEWCLGDWCPPIQVVLPAPYVNTYFYVKALERMKKIAVLTGHEWDIPMFDRRIRERKAAIMAAYYNTWDGNFIGGLQGANAFAVDIGLGDERTYPKLVEYYRNLGRFDTGISGTDVVTRVLFEHGDGQLAVDLLASQDPISFEGMRRAGATTLWENWPLATWDRSRNHPMFGAVEAYLFDYLLGIRQDEDQAGYRKIVIAPVLTEQVNILSGQRELPAGVCKVSYEKTAEKVTFKVTVPAGVDADFVFGGEEKKLSEGEQVLVYKL